MKKCTCASTMQDSTCPRHRLKPEAPRCAHDVMVPDCFKCYPRESAKDAGARGWWITDFNGYREEVYGSAYLCRDQPNDPNEAFIHVIEYGAYEKLERELAEAKQTIKTACDQLVIFKEQCEDEERKSAALIEALERIPIREAREAIEKYKKS